MAQQFQSEARSRFLDSYEAFCECAPFAVVFFELRRGAEPA